MRYALAVEYNGSEFCGWQSQKHCYGVQEALEKALSKVANEAIEVICSGRTDAGVHGIAQIVHFDTTAVRPDKAWMMGVNTQLEKSLSVHWVSEVSADFHARYSAIERHYRYVIQNRKARPGLESGRVAWVFNELDETLMHQGAQHLLGEHDFSAFRAAGCQAQHAIREIKSIRVLRQGQHVIIEICANAFIYNMVRIIVGNLLKVGKAEQSPIWIKELLESQDRTLGGATAVPCGLYFVGPRYPKEFAIYEEPLLD